jgi:hypothetical protein
MAAFLYVSLIPDCFSMLLSVPIGTSFLGCGTVTMPDFVREGVRQLVEAS